MGSETSSNPAPRSWRTRVFALSWLSYFSFYQTRKNVSVVKQQLEIEGLATRDGLAAMDTAYLSAYALGQFVWGLTADRVRARRLLALGMLGTAAMSLLFGLSSSFALIAIAFGVNGVFQSTGWPGNGRVMASWFSTKERGVVMGWWGTCYQAGPFVATVAAGWLLSHYGWRSAMIAPALWTATVAIALFLLLRDSPAEVGYDSVDGMGAADPADARRLRREALGVLVRDPTVWLLGASYSCIKLIRYSLWFWLPYYMGTVLNYEGGMPAYVSSAFELGGIAGVIASGMLADKMFGRRRIAVAMVMLVMLAGALTLYSVIGSDSVVANVLSLGLVGVLLFGPDSLVSGAAAQDAGGPHAAAASCGFINGIGSIGAMAQGLVTATVTEIWGWQALFKVFIALALFAALALLPLMRVRPRDG